MQEDRFFVRRNRDISFFAIKFRHIKPLVALEVGLSDICLVTDRHRIGGEIG